MSEIQITSAQYVIDPIDGEKKIIKIISNNQTLFVPINTNNRHYAEILKQVADGTLTIQDAD